MATDVKKTRSVRQIWSLVDWVKNLNAGIRRPSKLPIIDGGRMLALKLLPSGLPQIRWRGMEGGEFSFLTSDADVKKKKLNSPPSISRHHRWGGINVHKGN